MSRDLKTLSLAAMEARAALQAVPPGSFDMWPLPDPERIQQGKRDAVTAVLRSHGVTGPVDVTVLDELIAAAQTGI
jgi:hypothetical protein